MKFFDAHNHLQDEWLRPYLLDGLDLLPKLGVAGVVVNGTTEADWPEVAKLAGDHPWILPSYGLHPWFVGQRTGSWEENLEEQLDRGGVVGEIGLDRWKQPYDFADQQLVFCRQLQIATRRNVPATIHCLQAWGALLDILRAEPVPKSGFLLHAYGGPREMIAELTQLGAYFSFSGYFLHERKQERREIFGHIPLDRLLVETDAPAMPLPPELETHPLPLSPEGQVINHPANLVKVYEGLAAIRGLSLDALSETVAANFSRLFSAVRA